MNTRSFLALALCVVTLGAAAAVHADEWGRDKHGERDHRAARPHAEPARHEAVRHEAAHADPMRNHAFMAGMRAHERAEMVRGHTYWHFEHGVRYAHFYDRRGIHWYGYYWGPHFYWTRYWGNRWWWFDGPYHRWVYWWNGYWWYTGPGGVAYYYYGDQYVPYRPAVVVQPAAPAPPPSSHAGVGMVSPDGSRFVQITGPRSEAYLYDRSGGDNVYVNYLGPKVESVRFSGGANSGKPLQILVNYKDGSFGVFNANGKNLQGNAPEAAAPNQPPTPAPTAAPAATTGAPTSGPPPLDAAPPSADDQPPSAAPSDSDSQTSGSDAAPSAPPH